MEHDRNRHASTIHVLVADNSPFHTQLLVGALGREPDLKVFSSDLNAASVMAASIAHKIDVFVLSAFMDEDAERASGFCSNCGKQVTIRAPSYCWTRPNLNPFWNRSGQGLAGFSTIENRPTRSANAFARCMEGKSG